ncbi:uncharacterized protein METZ01_LOCUS103159 [marine metagenome]|uniref:Uncharacterized protein n=1 Tax=marine metagenome TaxID=408172 RepID=A0A381WCT6_9ZZZZ
MITKKLNKNLRIISETKNFLPIFKISWIGIQELS